MSYADDQSPTLSRTTSATFAPGPHRRSHPNLHHLSLAPLTPKYPIDPADYDAYFDPNTSELHSSTSLSQIAALPSPGGILTNSPVRSRASSRRRKVKSSVSIREPQAREETPHGALTSEGFGHRRVTSASKSAKSKSHLRLHTDPSWLIQTGLTLTEGSRESKGQAWITKRDSSTSLQTPSEEPRATRSGRGTPRNRSQRRSKRELAMTPATASTSQTPKVDEDEDVVADWADERTQAEIAAQLQGELEDEYDYNEDDPYGVLDFDGQFEDSDDDEEAVRQAISGYKLGQWMDGVVDAMLKIEEDNKPTDEEAQRTARTGSLVSDGEAPPEKPKTMWDDLAWFARLLGRGLKS